MAAVTGASSAIVGQASIVACRRGPVPIDPPSLEATLPSLEVGVTVAVCTYMRPLRVGRLLDSLLEQTRPPDRILIIDASDDARTEDVARCHPWARADDRLLYLRVAPRLRGLTRQRNIALQLTSTDLVAFFDDDILVLPGCLAEMERAHRVDDSRDVVGVGAVLENERSRPTLRWRLRAWLGMIPALEPGRYSRSGFSIPWAFLPPTERLVEGDWLPGGATMWRTEVVRGARFNESFIGYGSGEDLEFSLRIKRRGRLLMAGAARVQHHHEPSGRPKPFEFGYSSLQHAAFIHRSCLAQRSWRDAAWFLYAHAAEGLISCAALLRHGGDGEYRSFLKGYWAALLDQLHGSGPNRPRGVGNRRDIAQGPELRGGDV